MSISGAAFFSSVYSGMCARITHLYQNKITQGRNNKSATYIQYKTFSGHDFGGEKSAGVDDAVRRGSDRHHEGATGADGSGDHQQFWIDVGTDGGGGEYRHQ